MAQLSHEAALPASKNRVTLLTYSCFALLIVTRISGEKRDSKHANVSLIFYNGPRADL